jgi:hypothetical protein
MNRKQILTPFLLEHKWGYKDNKGIAIIDPIWDYAEDFHSGFAVVRNDKGLYGYLKSDGQLSIKCQFKEAMKFIDGVALVQNIDGKWEHINCNGEFLHNCPWIDVYPYSEGLAVVRKPINDIDQICGVYARYGYINEERELVIPCNYSEAFSFCNGYAKVTTEFGDSGYINKDGKFIWFLDKIDSDENIFKDTTLPKKWAKKNDLCETNPFNCDFDGNPLEDFTLSFKEGLAIVMGHNHKFGFINNEGTLVISCKWLLACPFHDGLAFVMGEDQKTFLKKNPKGGFINYQGDYIISPKWCCGFNFGWFDPTNSCPKVSSSEGLIAVRGKNNRWGYIDKKGKVQIPLRWIEARSFHEGRAAVKGLNGRYGFVDYRGNIVCTCKWAKVNDFHEGLARVYDDYLGKYGYIDYEGELVISCNYNSGSDFCNGLASVERYGEYFAIDGGGNRIEAEYDKPIDGETSSYERYRGSYAQDEMEYSDSDIDTIFDGDPDAYWNID